MLEKLLITTTHFSAICLDSLSCSWKDRHTGIPVSSEPETDTEIPQPHGTIVTMHLKLSLTNATQLIYRTAAPVGGMII